MKREEKIISFLNPSAVVESNEKIELYRAAFGDADDYFGIGMDGILSIVNNKFFSLKEDIYKLQNEINQ